MPKIYTKTGDYGKTNLYDMRNRDKDDPVFEVLGDIDELSAFIGLLIVELPTEMSMVSLPMSSTKVATLEVSSARIPIYPKEALILRKIQKHLLNIGSNIATLKNRKNIIPTTEQDILDLEEKIDFYTSKCPELKEFILPGYTKADSTAHICRAVCRRAERHLWDVENSSKIDQLGVGMELSTRIAVEPETFKYLNRLSDFFFSLARYLSRNEENEITRSKAL